MGKKSYGPPNVGISACLRDLPLRDLSWRYTIALLALTSLIAQSNALLHAEAPASLIISKDGANVNVSLDSQASSDVSIRRSDDIMMIKVPKSSPSKFIIDPSLKKDDIVQETETESGKTILIHSQQIYLMTQENLKDNPKDGNTKPATNSGKHATPKPTTETDASIQPAVDTSRHSDKPTTQPVSMGAGTPKNKAQLYQPPTIPLTIPNILLKTESSSAAGKTNQPASAKATAESANSEAPKTNITVKSATNPEPVDPESLPIDLSGQQQNTATQQSTGLMIRVTLSLVAVLAVLIAFIQVGLPKLMARYPEFFENLQQQARMKQGGHLAKADDEPDTSPSPRRSKKSGISFRSTPNQNLNAPVKYEPDSKRQYLERMNVHGSRLNVLNSTPIGKGSELHLVEVQGRQLVIATTPYTVSFVTDLTDGTPTEPALDLNAEPITHEIPSATPNGFPQITTSASSLGDTTASDVAPDQQTTQAIAYLSDDSPVIPTQSKQKPYGSVPHTTRQATIEPPEMASAAQAENSPKAEAVHQKYLGDTAPHAQPTAALSSKPPYVDAEEVIVLEDYDDVYGS